MVELSRPVSLREIGRSSLSITVRAGVEQRVAVAARMGIPAIRSLECAFNLTTEKDGVSVFATGRLSAEVTQVCVVSAEEFEARLEETFELRFVPSGREGSDLDLDQPDEFPYEGDKIDLGEATAQQLGLALDPYPRRDGLAFSGFDEDETPEPDLARRPGSDKTAH